jgi:cell division protein FtsL
MVQLKKETLLRRLLDTIKKSVFSSEGLPIVLVLCTLSLLVVLFRMKSIELDYQTVNLEKEIKKTSSRNKDLKGLKARLLNIKNLRKLAKKHDLSEPGHKQIIIIP